MGNAECELPAFHNTPDEIRQVLENHTVVAVVGLSTSPEKPSYGVAAYLQSQGYRIIPVHPKADEILGEKAYPDLLSIPKEIRVEIVDLFRRPDQVLPHVEEAIQIGAKVVWMQDGVINNEAAARARDAGLVVIMNRCMLREHSNLNA